MGKIDHATELVESAIEYCSNSGIMSVKAKMAVPEAMLMIQHGDVKRGFACFEDAVEMLDGLPLHYYRSRILFEYGQALRRQRQRRRADEEFARASSIFQEMGVTALLSMSNRERRAGRLGPRSVSTDGLTPPGI